MTATARPIAPALVVAFMGCTAVALASIDSTTMMLWVIVGVGLTCLEVGILWWRANGFSPAGLLVAIVNAIGIVGACFYPLVADRAAVSAIVSTAERDLVYALQVVLAFTGAVTVGAILTTPRLAAQTLRDRIEAAPVAIRPAVLMTVGLVPLGLGLMGKGDALWYIQEYGTSSGYAPALTVAITLAPFAELALSLAAFGAGPRMLAWFGLGGWAALHFAAASRQLALLPGVILIGYLLSPGPRRRLGAVKVALVAAATLQLSSMAVLLRSNPTGVGLRPLSQAVLDGESRLLDPAATVGNLLFSTPLTAASAKAISAAGAETFMLSVNPTPGVLTEWPIVSRRLRLNGATPFNSLGELAGAGWPYLLGYGLVVGLALGVALRLILTLPTPGPTLALLMSTALVALFAVTLLQYNLRSSTRLLYYLLAGLLLLGPLLRARGRPDASRADATTSVGAHQ